LWYATGHGRNGVLLAGLTGEIIGDLVSTGATEVEIASLAPERFTSWMFRSCAFCNAAFDGDGGPSGLASGVESLSMNGGGGCGSFAPAAAAGISPRSMIAWNASKRGAGRKPGRIAASTAQVSLIRWGYDFVRVGKPPRVELATWRYGRAAAQSPARAMRS